MALIAVTNGSLDAIIFDNGLSHLTANADNLHLCSQAPTNYTEATSTYTLANKTGITVGSPEAGTTGRKVVVSAITSGGNNTGNGGATNWAIVDVPNTLLLATGTVPSDPYAIDASASTNDSSITLDNAAGALPTALVNGDLIVIAGSVQQYEVTSYSENATDATVGISPNLDQNVTDGVVVRKLFDIDSSSSFTLAQFDIEIPAVA
jgi:hypothetical protein